MNFKFIGSKVRIVRQIKGVSQEALAVKLDISQAAFSKIENGKTVLTGAHLEVILRELNITDKTLRDFDLNEIFKEGT